MSPRSRRERGGRRGVEGNQSNRVYCSLSFLGTIVKFREKKGFCCSKECSPEKHGRIVMSHEWIQNNVTNYILLMINLCEKYNRDYMVGVRYYLEKKKYLISRIKPMDVIPRVVDCKV